MTQDQRRLRDSLDEILAQIGVFALAGPSIGAGVFSLILLFWAFLPEGTALRPHPTILSEEYSGIAYVFVSIAFALLSLVFTIPFSYLLAGLAAALTGLVVAMAWFWMLRSKWLFLLAAIVGGVSSVLNLFAAKLVDVMLAVPKMNFNRFMEDMMENFLIIAILVFITGAASAIICTYLTKSFRQNEQPPSSEAAPHPNVTG